MGEYMGRQSVALRAQTRRAPACIPVSGVWLGLDLVAMRCNRHWMLPLLVWLLLEVAGSFARGSYRTRYPARRYLRRYRPRHRHYYLEPSYERVYETSYIPDHEDDVIYRSVERSRPVLALSGVGYVANSGGALHIVGRDQNLTEI